MTDAEERNRLLRAIRSRLTAVVIILSAVALFFAKDLFLPIILGLLIALTLSPVVRALGRIGMPAGASAVLLVFGLAIGLSSIFFVMSTPVSRWIEDAPSMGRTLEWKLRGINDAVQAVQDASQQVDEIAVERREASDVQKVEIARPGLLDSAVDTVVQVATSTFVSLLLALFLLASNNLFYEKLIAAFPRFSDKKRALRAVYDVERKVSRYLFTITVINACLGTAIGLVLFALGLKDAYIWGIFAFLLNFLPYIGMIVGTTLVAIFSIVSFDSVSYAMLCPAAYFVLSSIEGQFITPLIVGRRLEINTVSVFLTVVFWGWLWGIAGALMAVPFLVLIKVVCDNTPGFEMIGNFLGARDNESDATETREA